MVQVGDWVRLHEDALQNEEHIPSEMLLLVTEVTDTDIKVKAPSAGACEIYWHHEYDVVKPWDHVQVQGGDNLTVENCTVLLSDPGVRSESFGSLTLTLPNAEPDLVNQPPHYKIKGDMEVIDVIEALAKDDAWYANAIKYLLRAKEKGKLTEDLGKCKFYIDRMLRDAESEAK